MQMRTQLYSRCGVMPLLAQSLARMPFAVIIAQADALPSLSLHLSRQLFPLPLIRIAKVAEGEEEEEEEKAEEMLAKARPLARSLSSMGRNGWKWRGRRGRRRCGAVALIWALLMAADSAGNAEGWKWHGGLDGRM